MASLATNVAELTVFSTSKCSKTDEEWIYLNFSILVVLKVFTLSMINLELIKRTPYKQSVPFFVPFCVFGFFPLLQWPQNTFDYYTCAQRNVIFPMHYALQCTQSLGIISLALIAWELIQYMDIIICSAPRLHSCFRSLVATLRRYLPCSHSAAWNRTSSLLGCKPLPRVLYLRSNGPVPDLLYDHGGQEEERAGSCEFQAKGAGPQHLRIEYKNCIPVSEYHFTSFSASMTIANTTWYALFLDST